MRPDLSKFLWAALLIAGLEIGARAAAPVNDRCPNAISISANGIPTAIVDITEATTTGDPPPPSCAEEVSRSVWYLFRPAAPDVYRISTCGESGLGTTVRDTVMAIYTAVSGCASGYTEIACSDDRCNWQSEITTNLNANVNYYIVVWQNGTTAPAPGQGLLQLRVDRGGPANDDCSSPQPVSLNVPVIGRTMYARNDYDLGNSLCFTGIEQTPVDTPGPEVVFFFKALADDTYAFRAKNYGLAEDANYDLVIYVSPVCPLPDPSGTMNDCLEAANRHPSSLAEEVCVSLTNNQEVYIFVDDRHPASPGSPFILEVTRCVSEVEPNGSTSSAPPYLFETRGTNQPVDEVDLFALGSFTPGSRVFALVDAVSASRPDYTLRVVSSTDTLEYDSDNNDKFYGQLSGSVAGTPLTDDCAWLRVRQEFVSLPYRLYAVVQPPLSNATLEVEPNGTIQEAQARFSPKGYFYGNLPGLTDEDIYAFDAVAGDTIFVGLDADPLRDRSPIDAQLELLNSAGSIIMLVDDLSDTSNTNASPGVLDGFRPFSPAESIVCRAPYTGRYYARALISPFASAGLQGDYLLSITKNGFLGAGATNIPPVILNLSAPPVPQNSNAVVTATISDPDVGAKFTVTINWGDSTPNSVLTLGSCEYSFEGTHQYAQRGTYPVTVSVRDIHGGTASAATSIQVTVAKATIESIRYQANGSVLLEMKGTPGATYQIETSQDLKLWGSWTNRTADAAGRFQVLDSPPPPLPPLRRFYRAVWRQ